MVNILKIGADIEMFLQNKKGKIVSAEGYVKGTKYNPFVFDPENKYFSTSLDNVMAEFTIPPVDDRKNFIEYIKRGIGYINTINPDLKCIAQPAARLDWEYLKTENAQMFGCEPDMNAYTMWTNPRPKAEGKNLRTAGFHVHISYENPYPVYDLVNPDETYIKNDTIRCIITKAMDLFLSVNMVLIEPENERKVLYGKAGAYRPKPYGLEYRSLSNYAASSPKMMGYVFDQTLRALKWLEREKNQTLINSKGFSEYLENTINQNNKKQAKYLKNKFKI